MTTGEQRRQMLVTGIKIGKAEIVLSEVIAELRKLELHGIVATTEKALAEAEAAHKWLTEHRLTAYAEVTEAK